MASMIKQAQSAQSIDQIRAKARRRLIGAIILVVLAVAVLPWLFESQPRDSVVETAIEIAGTTTTTVALPVPAPSVQIPALPPLRDDVQVLPPAEGSPTEPSTPVNTAGGYVDPFVDPNVDPAITPTTTDTPVIEGTGSMHAEAQGGTDLTLSDGYAVRPPDKPHISSKVPPNMRTTASASMGSQGTTPALSADGARAAALLGEPATLVRTPVQTSPPSTPRPNEQTRNFVVQVGAYADETKANEVRAKLTMAGYTSYVQEVQTEAGKRIRVRLGPFVGRQAADSVAEKIKGMGLAAAVLPS